MKKVFQKIGSLGMAFLVLFSTMSFTVGQHFCGEVLIDQAVFSEVEPCCMELHDPASSETSKENGSLENNCCSQEKVAFEGQDELSLAHNQLDFQQQVFLGSFTYSFLNLFEGLPEQVIPFKDYSPPLLVSNIQLLDQTFLI